MEREQPGVTRSGRNRTMVLTNSEQESLISRCLKLEPGQTVDTESLAPGGVCEGQILLMDAFEALPRIQDQTADLILFDPPYNLRKSFHGWSFLPKDHHEYLAWIGTWVEQLARILKPGGSLYLCSDWRSSASVQIALGSVLNIRNRITWEREKGRGSLDNWKNASEDIWFATKGDSYYFDTERTKLRRKVVAPYRDSNGKAKDWVEGGKPGPVSEPDGTSNHRTSDKAGGEGRYRDTFPSNMWTDLTVPFWSMPENTEHPTQKPEKLAAKLILASSPPGALVFDPCAGSGSFLAAAKKLGRRTLGIERNPYYAALCRKRLDEALTNTRIQGYEKGVFYERNSNPGG